MDAVTYPNSEVADFISKNLIPLRIGSDVDPYAGQFNVKWTPKILILDSTGKIHQDNVGFYPPEEFIASLELGMAKMDFDLDCLEETTSHLDHILAKYPQTPEAAEAIFIGGVAEYKKSGSGEPLKNAYKKLREKYPNSEWATRAAPYRLL
jgi:hypothetical protein